MKYITSLILSFLLASTALAGDFYLKSSAFEDHKRIPSLYTCEGKNISPPLNWGNAPANTKSFALIFETPDWGSMKVYLWVLYNIPATVKSLPEDLTSLPEGTLIGTNYYDETNYRGPCAPDTQLHNYLFTLYALDKVFYPIESEIDPDKLLIIMQTHILGKTQLLGQFSH
jgi:Raf kinase inhibitor-like YbhB/YbcL family protein